MGVRAQGFFFVFLFLFALGVFVLPEKSSAQALQQIKIESITVDGKLIKYLVRNNTYNAVVTTTDDFFVGDRADMNSITVEAVAEIANNVNIVGQVLEKEQISARKARFKFTTNDASGIKGAGAIAFWVKEGGSYRVHNSNQLFLPELQITDWRKLVPVVNSEDSPVRSETQGQEFFLTVQGDGFFSPVTVAFSNSDIQLVNDPGNTVVDDTEIRVKMRVSATAPVGMRDLLVTVAPTADSSDRVTATVPNAFAVSQLENVLLSIDKVTFNPSVADPGSQVFLSMSGSGFTNSNTVTFADYTIDLGISGLQVLPAATFTDTKIAVNINIPADATSGVKTLTVTRRNPNGTITSVRSNITLTIKGEVQELPTPTPPAEPETGPRFKDVKVTTFPKSSIFELGETHEIVISGDFTEQFQSGVTLNIAFQDRISKTPIQGVEISGGTFAQDGKSLSFSVSIAEDAQPTELASLGVAFGEEPVISIPVAIRKVGDRRPPPNFTLPRGEAVFGTGPELVATIQRVANWVFAFAIAISLIFIVLAAFQFVTGGGDPTQVQQARQKLMYAAIGIVVGLLVAGIRQIIRSIVTG